MTDHIAELSFIGLIAFFLYGIGFVIYQDMNHTAAQQTECLSHGMQFVEGNCLR
jgi:hypothetical protein